METSRDISNILRSIRFIIERQQLEKKEKCELVAKALEIANPIGRK